MSEFLDWLFNRKKEIKHEEEKYLNRCHDECCFCFNKIEEGDYAEHIYKDENRCVSYHRKCVVKGIYKYYTWALESGNKLNTALIPEFYRKYIELNKEYKNRKKLFGCKVLFYKPQTRGVKSIFEDIIFCEKVVKNE